MTDTVTQFCECYEDMCFCTETFEMPLGLVSNGMRASWRCTPCMQGRHVWTEGGTREPPTPEQQKWAGMTGILRFPTDPHGYGLCFITSAVLLFVFIGLGLVAIFVIAGWL